MAGEVHSKATRVHVAGYDLSPYLQSASAEITSETHDKTVFIDTARRHHPGLKDGSFSGGGLYSDEEGSILDALDAADGILSYWPAGDLPGARGHVFGSLKNAKGVETPVGDLIKVSLGLQANNDLDDARSLMEMLERSSGLINGTAVNEARRTDAGAIGYIHVPQVEGTLNVKIQHSPNNSVWTDLITFPAITTPHTNLRIETAPGTVVERYLRAVQVSAGPATKYAVAYSRGFSPSVESYIGAALGLGPSLLWTLGAISLADDRSPSNNDGAALGGVTIGGFLNGPTDFFDSTATNFDGVDDGISSVYNPFVGVNERTFVGWARREAGGPAEQTLISSSGADTVRPNLRVVDASGNVRFLPGGNDGQVTTWTAAAPSVSAGWFMWALKFRPNNDTATLYIDGQKIATQAATENWDVAPGTFQVGVGALMQNPWKGQQGLVAVYEKGLTDAEIASLYAASQM